MKKSIVISLIVMALCVVVGVVGVTAAWFGDTYRRASNVIITSYAPTGNATMSIESTSDFTSGEGLMPAVASEGYILAQRNGSLNLDSIDVLSNSSITNGYITQVATQVTMEFDFAYAGTADAGYSNKAIAIKLASVTLQNPREYITVAEYQRRHGSSPDARIRYTQDETGVYTQNDVGEFARDYLDLDDYKEEFNFEMHLAKYFAATEYDGAYAYAYYVRTGVGVDDDCFAHAKTRKDEETGEIIVQELTEQEFKAENAPTYYYIDSNNTYTWTNRMTDDYTLYILAMPRVEAKFSFTVNFARVDEETNPLLINTTLFFNFEINVASR